MPCVWFINPINIPNHPRTIFIYTRQIRQFFAYFRSLKTSIEQDHSITNMLYKTDNPEQFYWATSADINSILEQSFYSTVPVYKLCSECQIYLRDMALWQAIGMVSLASYWLDVAIKTRNHQPYSWWFMGTGKCIMQLSLLFHQYRVWQVIVQEKE